MNSLDQKMLQIKSLDSGASVGFSQATFKWYVLAGIEIGEDGMLTGIAEHELTPMSAIEAYFNRLTNIDPEQYLVTGMWERRRHWRWNGAAFAEMPT